MLNTNTKNQHQQIKSMKETAFIPEQNQPNIKSVITQKTEKNKKSAPKGVQKGLADPKALNKESKKHSPPMPLDRSIPAKRINMSQEVNDKHEDISKNVVPKNRDNDTGDNNPIDEKMDDSTLITPQPEP